MDHQQDSQALVEKKAQVNMEVVMKSYMNHKFLMSSIRCIKEMQSLNKCLVSIQIDTLLKRSALSCKLIKKAEVFKV
jgi:hypothetical protein